ncbi:chorismate synthase [Clostridium botulinum D/C]|uniref:chorismate synthase n=1 Tax=Clostridium botulinum TaxID=1491 RepID=UPI001E3D661F|nr:chorismate synthase [Clostridium botulinum]MCD3352127.1 chorismate synthase [Clostridium botulinum D/C]MCD3361074.1 chorismate synthase [Clostridium botulinum D/C]MCD3363231.1 chorismate synthase [Clostridium botulinum D/C]MCD3366832.1 chorismate synthase [Clostridium botulinum D/C]
MSGIWGSKIKYSIFGESHGKAIGITIDGLPAGIELDLNEVNREMRRRAPGKSKLSTSRVEMDEFEILSGYFNNKTTGTPLCAIIQNLDKHSKDYEKTKDLMRPGHADFTGYIKYSGFNDYRGGGHFSGRLTAPIVFAGAIAKQILKRNNIIIGSHIKSIGSIEEEYFRVSIKEEVLEELSRKTFATIDDEKGKEMQEAILELRNNMDSIGGIIECAVLNMPPGLGEPFFGSVESVLSSLLFSIPAVKGVEFGAGFSISKMKGSQANDEFYIENEKVKTYTNNNGGILGGITNGMPLIFRSAFKPTPSIAKEQKTINILNKENTTIKIQGRHDPCIVQRAVPVVEAITAMGILELI